MNFKTIKLICIALLVVSIITFPTRIFAFSNIYKDGNGFIQAGKNEDPVIDDNVMQGVSAVIYKILLTIAIIIAIVWGTFIGIQLMMQGAEGKAQMKEALLPYVIGCIIGFSAFGIWKVIVVSLQNSGL